jgi:hypothetical protein
MLEENLFIEKLKNSTIKIDKTTGCIIFITKGKEYITYNKIDSKIIVDYNQWGNEYTWYNKEKLFDELKKLFIKHLGLNVRYVEQFFEIKPMDPPTFNLSFYSQFIYSK